MGSRLGRAAGLYSQAASMATLNAMSIHGNICRQWSQEMSQIWSFSIRNVGPIFWTRLWDSTLLLLCPEYKTILIKKDPEMYPPYHDFNQNEHIFLVHDWWLPEIWRGCCDMFFLNVETVHIRHQYYHDTIGHKNRCDFVPSLSYCSQQYRRGPLTQIYHIDATDSESILNKIQTCQKRRLSHL